MYEFSRDLYRELKPLVIAGAHDDRARRLMLRACEASIERMASGEAYGTSPARSLFGQLRGLFGAQDQLRALGIIERRMAEAAHHFAAERAERPSGSLLRCVALNRKGRPCGREPMRGSRYCPSHRHVGARRAELGASVA